jgi:hypothetical protein
MLSNKVRKPHSESRRNRTSRILKAMPPFVGGDPNPGALIMPDKIKKTKAPAKPRKTAAKKQKAAPPATPVMPSREEIEQLARAYWAQRGYQDGCAEQDWLRAEQELLKMAS